MYQIALENYERLLAAWEAGHPEQAEKRGGQAPAG
jgi:hypothetical protein